MVLRAKFQPCGSNGRVNSSGVADTYTPLLHRESILNLSKRRLTDLATDYELERTGLVRFKNDYYEVQITCR